MYSYRIEQAIRAATILHKDQVRKGSVPLPYISHLVAVAFIVSSYTESEDAFIAALLHDTLEDTDYTKAELVDDFGPKVASLVTALTHSRHDEDASRDTKNERYLRQLKNASEDALIISAADKIHNMRSIVEEYIAEPKRYTRDFPQPLAEAREFYAALLTIFEEQLDNDITEEYSLVFTEYSNFLTHVQETIT